MITRKIYYVDNNATQTYQGNKLPSDGTLNFAMYSNTIRFMTVQITYLGETLPTIRKSGDYEMTYTEWQEEA